jgi:phospholipase/carboxylesterase
MSMTSFAPPVVTAAGNADPRAPLVVLLHGRGSDEAGIIGLAEALPVGYAYAAVRAPIAEGGGYAWFANRGIGRPVAESIEQTVAWFHEWLDETVVGDRPVVLVGFSGGAAFAGGLVLTRPTRYAGAAVLYGTMPFDAGLDTSAGRLAGLPVFIAQGDNDHVIPLELQQRTWDYVHGASGATAASHRDDASHGISRAALDALADWLSTVAVRPEGR